MDEAAAPLQEAAPERIGPFRLLRLLGEGAMGRVYLAEQWEPRRLVALKLLKAAAGGGEDRQRFHREAQLLAALEHPGIARIYQVGAEQGTTGTLFYLALEFVDGQNLLAYAQRHALDVVAKLALLAKICRAVHHAHTRGVIHRDLKPANILVDAHGQPKVLDFGVARVIGDDGLTRMTMAGEVIGTLPYMSWEQLTGDSAALDPRSDLYSLGAIAYELLAGQLPFPGLDQGTLISAIEQVRTGTPLPLSRLLPAARGDIETVVMKALAREPEQRYASAAELAADLERMVERQPIAARPPTARYLVGLFVRRHRALSAAIGLALAGVIGGAVLALQFALSEARANRAAEQRAGELAAVNGFLQQMLRSADPAQARGPDLSVRELLDAAALNLRGETAELNPSAAAQLRSTIGATYLAIGSIKPALGLLEAAQGQLLAQYGGDDSIVLRNQRDLALALAQDGQVDAATRLYEPLLRRPAGTDARSRRERIQLRSIYFEHFVQNGGSEAQKAEMLALLRESQGELGPADPVTANLQIYYAHALYMAGRWPEAATQMRELLQALPSEDSLWRESAQTVLTRPLRELGELEEAERIARDSLERVARRLGQKHGSTLIARHNLLSILVLREKFAEVEPLARQLVLDMTASFGATSTGVMGATATHGRALLGLGRSAEAEAVLREALELIARSGVSPRSSGPLLFDAMVEALLARKKIAEAGEWAVRAVQSSVEVYGEDHPITWYLRSGQAECLARSGQLEPARELLERALPKLTGLHGPRHPRVQRAQARYKTVMAAR